MTIFSKNILAYPWPRGHDDGSQPLQFAASMGHLAVLENLLASRRVQTSTISKAGTQPFYVAIAHGHVAVAEHLPSRRPLARKPDRKLR